MRLLFVSFIMFKDLLSMPCIRQLRWKTEETDLLMGTLGAPPANLHTEPLCLEHAGMHYYQPGYISQTPHQLQPLSEKVYNTEAVTETEANSEIYIYREKLIVEG